MTASTSRLAYDDAYAIMDAAIVDDKGVRVRMLDHAAANHMRARCHMARVLDRRENAATYERPHPMHGVSAYDRLKLTIEEDGVGCWLMLIRNNVIPGEVESLTTGEQLSLDLTQLMPPPRQLQIEPPKAPLTDGELGDAFDALPTVDGEEPRPKPMTLRRV